jgi:putative membrane protein
MIFTWAVGLTMVYLNPDLLSQGWFHAKLTLLLLLSGFHGASAGWMKKFARDANTKSSKFYRVANEVPTVIMIAIVFIGVIRPF